MNFQGQLKPVITMVAVNFGFAAVNVLLKKILDQGTNHLVIVAYRQLISAIFLAPIAYFVEREIRPKLTLQILCQLFFSALVGVTLAQYFLLLGLKYTSATFSCAFINMVPVITFLLALPFGLEKVNLKSLAGGCKVFGTLVCFGGVILLILYKGKPLINQHHLTKHGDMTFSTSKTESWAIGTIFLIAGCIVWSSWFLMQARIGKRYPCQYSSTAILSSFGAIQSAILCLIMEKNLSGWILQGKLEIASIIYAGVVGSGLCYVGMSWSVKQRGPVFTSAFTPLIQIFVAIFDFSILHGPLHLGSVVGSILLIMGLYILLWGKSKEIEVCQTQTKQAQVGQLQDEQSTAVSHIIPVTSDSTVP
ncbi:WAT1-related protein At3g30340-like [Pistacia vera]|uniref:WAT1-related protein At3g30340-like n=1 Tax=Pistacia vera TaxID=55513 RepID=UPI0012636FB2|nr:WAT1-related protein At3g30340-like [Pistacia vera]XP_031251734.1 WAT1-related protein At3g30340-like [Pistacia vera]